MRSLRTAHLQALGEMGNCISTMDSELPVVSRRSHNIMVLLLQRDHVIHIRNAINHIPLVQQIGGVLHMCRTSRRHNFFALRSKPSFARSPSSSCFYWGGDE